ncbi:hypothetical protein [Micromonospora sp. NPDC092111]|uniref:hypothetical protein n=1 Tax=Micromonospora sp. NPDC092111 TaxID=3364289 RepID=UPI00380F587E
MRELPPPWNDLTGQRKRKLEELPHTRASEQAALDALTAVLSDLPSGLRHGWRGDSWEEFFYRFRNETGHRLGQLMPTADLLTQEGVTDVLRQWAQTADPPVPAWWFEGESDQIVRERADSVLSGWAHDLLWWLRQEPRDAARVAAVAERCIRDDLAAHDAVYLLNGLGAPHGEQALLRVVRDDGVRESTRAGAREWLWQLRRPGYEARGREPAHGEEPLLPPVVREVPYSWDSGFQWPGELPETAGNIARARAILEACAPAGPVPEPVPAASWDGDQESPAWLEVRAVLRSLIRYARQVTRERLTEAMRECALLGIPGVPQDPEGAEAERFVQRWVTWIGAWIADEVFRWLGVCVDDRARITPWAMELAEQYARNGVGGEQTVGMLRWHHTVPRSREALARIAADDSLPPELRELAGDS